jgi:diadenosine tetraphosphate (Ap4A) HIT family hydrolase
MKDGCEFCENRFEHTRIKEYQNWQIQLFLNQYYPGRCLIKLKDHKVDLTELSPEERDELFEKVLPELKNAVDELFNPDLYNHATLGNDCRHFHLHFIPRYREKRELNGEIFRDQNWNSDYKPYPKDFEISEETFEKIKQDISAEISGN